MTLYEHHLAPQIQSFVGFFVYFAPVTVAGTKSKTTLGS